MKKKWLNFVFALVLLSGVNNSINAQTTADTLSIDDYYSMSIEELMNIDVVSASKVKQKQSDAPNIITVVPQNKINQYGWLSINDILYSQPGFQPSYDYERRTVGFRGMSEGWNNNHYLMLVDGIPFNDNLYGTAYTWEITPLIFTNSMEIIRGAGGALYGTSAMNGVITLNTSNAENFDDFGIARFRVETNNSQVYDFAVGNEGDNFGLVLAFNHYETAGNEYNSYDASGREDAFGNLIKYKTFDQRSSSYLFAKVYGKGKLEGLSFQYHEQQWDFKTGHGWLFTIPDEPENMKEYRRIFALKYATHKDKIFNWEAAAKYQKHGVDWDMRYQYDGQGDNFFPHGLNEYLRTDGEDIWARLQGEFNLKNHIIIAGVEGDIFLYNGDEAHNANYDMNTWLINPDTFNVTYSLDPWFEYVDDKPVKNIAVYAQYMSPKFFDKLQITLSGRYDQMFFEYDSDLENNTEALKNKNFSMFTPRIATVYNLNEDITVKAIFGKAFRTPAPTEMFGSNTYTLASNIEQLEPEESTNFDLGFDWKVNDNINFRLNGFWVNFENIIAYSIANYNLSTNIFSQETAGFETEFQVAFGDFSGFANLTYATRLDETIADSTITESKDKVTWAPPITANIGLLYNHKNFYTSLLFHYQGEVERRNLENDIHRSKTVEAWINIDLKFAYKITQKIEFGLTIKNLTDSERFIIKNYAYPFDYRLEERSILFDLLFRF